MSSFLTDLKYIAEATLCLVLMISLFLGQGLRDPWEAFLARPETRGSVLDG